MAAGEAGEDRLKTIRQSHLDRAMLDVVEGRSVMQQSLFNEGETSGDDRLMRAVESAELRWRKTAQVAVGMAVAGVVLALIAVAVALMRTM